jgi:hypothetical protein
MKTTFLETALALDATGAQYQIEFRADEAVQFVSALPSEEQAAAWGLLGFIKYCNKTIPAMDYGVGNPNTGHSHHRFLIGREYSRVVYLQFAKAYFPKGYDFNKLASRLSARAKRAEADEVNIHENTDMGFKMRVWWD